MAETVYVLCMLMSLACAIMLIRGFFKFRSRLLLWSSACFGMLAVNNAILFIDMMVFPELDFGGVMLRTAAQVIAGSLLLFGLIWEIS